MDGFILPAQGKRTRLRVADLGSVGQTVGGEVLWSLVEISDW